jgi:uncharacterized phage protein (TIGR01671 family)
VSRVFKFRVWDGTKYRLDTLIYNGRAYESVEDFGGTFTSGRVLSIIPKAVIQQFTGLMDAKGKEVFEGDIIKFEEYWGGDYRYKGGHAVVKFFDNAFDLEETRREDWMDLWECVKNNGGVIVGNIFENPELLKEHNGN